MFEGIWKGLEVQKYPEWTVLVLDEIDHIQSDSNYDPSDFFYRLLRGEGRLQRDISLSVWLCSTDLLEADLRLDSRVRSALGGKPVFFPPYDATELTAILKRAIRSVLTDLERWGASTAETQLVRNSGRSSVTGRPRGRDFTGGLSPY